MALQLAKSTSKYFYIAGKCDKRLIYEKCCAQKIILHDEHIFSNTALRDLRRRRNNILNGTTSNQLTTLQPEI